ncbi:hypothetical protein H2248_009127 [Termitomyces sp. 'cryptogamus']|nr:hypothetical protein H2248_009127 [Termitomyces sp. 'cryptogamus']
MPSFSRLVNRLMLLNRVRHNKVLTTKSKADVAIRPFLTATTLPISLSQEIPQELYERIIDHLHNDIMSLLACSLVCRAWVPASRYHLFKHCVVHPLRLTWPGERNVRVNCAVSLSVSQLILYGADDGIYLSRTPVTSPKPALFLPDPVDHIDVLEDFNLIILLSAQQIFTVQLNILNLSAPRNISSCTRISSHVSSFSCGVLSGKHLVCAVKRGLSTTCKLLEPVLDINTQTYKLSPYKDFYIEERVASLHFLKTNPYYIHFQLFQTRMRIV